MSSKNGYNRSKIFFLPFMSPGHTIPVIDIAKLFSSRGIQTTIITTPLNAPLFSKPIKTTKKLGNEIQLLVINFPSKEAGLPEDCESFDLAQAHGLMQNFFKATAMLESQVDHILNQHRPNCLFADTFFPWTTNVCAKYEIPRLVFHGTCFFALCAASSVISNNIHKRVLSDSEPFIIPSLPDEIKMTRGQLPGYLKQEVETEFTKVYKASKEAEVTSYGIVVNSFYELEHDYVDHYRNVLGRKSWHIGPVSLCNKEIEDKVERGLGSSIDEHECLKWLDLKKPDSVLYISFGSKGSFGTSQLKEIAMALEACGVNFIWVVKKQKNAQDQIEDAEWLPQGFEKRVGERGLIIRGWAPQVLILEHESIGGFMTHCGWNSTLEGVASGVPMVTWPISAEQFYNEKLVSHVLRIGVGVGANKWGGSLSGSDCIKREGIEKTVKCVMVSEEGEEMRRRAKGFGDLARRAVEEGGSSYLDLNALIEELRLGI